MPRYGCAARVGRSAQDNRRRRGRRKRDDGHAPRLSLPREGGENGRGLGSARITLQGSDTFAAGQKLLGGAALIGVPAKARALGLRRRAGDSLGGGER